MTATSTATTATTASTRHRTLCTFRLADLHLGIDVTKVQEVIRRQDVTRIPLVPPVLHGLINLRGEIVTAIDLRRRMHLEAAPSDVTSMNVIIRTAEGAVSLVVDEIDDVVDVDYGDFEPPPPTLHGHRRALVSGVFKLDGGLLLVLDLDRVLDPGDLLSSADEPFSSLPHTPHSARVPSLSNEVTS